MARTVLLLTALCSVPAACYATNAIGAGLDSVHARGANNKYAVSSDARNVPMLTDTSSHSTCCDTTNTNDLLEYDTSSAVQWAEGGAPGPPNEPAADDNDGRMQEVCGLAAGVADSEARDERYDFQCFDLSDDSQYDDQFNRSSSIEMGRPLRCRRTSHVLDRLAEAPPRAAPAASLTITTLAAASRLSSPFTRAVAIITAIMWLPIADGAGKEKSPWYFGVLYKNGTVCIYLDYQDFDETKTVRHKKFRDTSHAVCYAVHNVDIERYPDKMPANVPSMEIGVETHISCLLAPAGATSSSAGAGTSSAGAGSSSTLVTISPFPGTHQAAAAAGAAIAQGNAATLAAAAQHAATTAAHSAARAVSLAAGAAAASAAAPSAAAATAALATSSTSPSPAFMVMATTMRS